MDMLPALGPMIGWGESGYVFEDYNDPSKVIKIVEIRPQIDGVVRPFRETFPHSSVRSRKVARNELQTNFYSRIVGKNFNPHLPKIYDLGIDKSNAELRNAIRESQRVFHNSPEITNEMLREFSGNSRVAWWVMEKIPNMVYNDWGGYLQYPVRTGWRSGDYRQMVPQEQQAYESLVKDLFKRANIVIRDVTNPANMGFRNDGTPVWFDATVSTWPIHAKMKDSPRLMDREQYDLFAEAFGEDVIKAYEDAIADGSYFRERHGLGANLAAEGFNGL